jgi:Fe-S-cluster-containing dehydrogenase component
MNREISRRELLKAAGLLGTTLLSGFAPYVYSSLTKSEPASTGYGWEKHRWGFVVDATRCIGCGRCVLACKLENDVPMDPRYTRTWIERYVIDAERTVLVDSPRSGIEGFEPSSASQELEEGFFVPKLCNQCDNPPCVQVCPVGATYKTEDGVVLVDRERCIGCRYCIQACPYGARYLDPRNHIVDKCTWCYHRITEGLLPVCVEVCPVGARVFGDLRDPTSPVRKVIQVERVNVLKPDLGTKPRVYYVGLQEGVR